jgi:hypothetical protein
MEGVHLDDRPHCQETYLRSFRAQEDFKIEVRLRRYDEHYRWMLNHGVPLFGPEGKFIGFIGSCVDITSRKHTEEAVQRLNTELEGRVAARTAALRESHEQMESSLIPWPTICAHRFAPCRVLPPPFWRLRIGSRRPGERFHAWIMASAQRMDALIQDLLAYSQPPPLLLEKVRLRKSWKACVHGRPEIKSKQATSWWRPHCQK